MPLSGGPSDKAGHHFEMLWVVHCMVQVVLGRSTSVRPEPPSAEGVDLLVVRGPTRELHQAKRATSAAGRWTVSSLSEVLEDFRTHLVADAASECVFVSGNSAPELAELSDRARSAESSEEFSKSFLEPSQVLKASFEQLCGSWNAHALQAWQLLRRIRIEVIGESQLGGRLDDLLGVVFEGDPSNTRAILEQLFSESTHRTLMKAEIEKHLANRGVRRRQFVEDTENTEFLPPPHPYGIVGRETLAEACRSAIRVTRVLVLSGPSGIGKSAMLSLVSANINLAPAFWLDGAVVGGFRGVVAALDTAFSSAGAKLDATVHHPSASAEVVGRHVAYAIDQLGAIVGWDDVQTGDSEQAFIRGLAAGLRKGVVAITTRDSGTLVRIPGLQVFEVPPLSREANIELLMQLVGSRPPADIVEATGGHPCLIHLAAGLLRQFTPEVACEIFLTESADWARSALLASLSGEQRQFLRNAAIFRAGFRSEWVVKSSGDTITLMQLVGISLVTRRSETTYGVHDLVRAPLLETADNDLLQLLHSEAAMRLLPITRTSPDALGEYAYHALNAGMLAEGQRATSAQVFFAAQKGRWSRVLDTTEILETQKEDLGWSVPWYFRGRALRMQDELKEALSCYRKAQNGSDAHILAVSRFEEASVLALLGDTVAASDIYKTLGRSSDSIVAIESEVALSLIECRELRYKAVAARMKRARARALALKLGRTVAQVDLTWGIIALRLDRPGEALGHLKACYERKMKDGGESYGHDIIGWHALYDALTRAEMQLGNREETRGAAFGLWQFAILSENLRWIAEATYYLSNAAQIADTEARLAREDLHGRLRRSAAGRRIRAVVGYLAASYWCAGDPEEALACHLQFDAESEGIPVIFIRGERADNVPAWSGAESGGAVWFYFLGAQHTDEYMRAVFVRLRARFPHSDRRLSVFERGEGP